MGEIIGIAVGIAALLLGAKGFSKDGLPFTNTKRLTGTGAKIIGAICILIGVVFIAGAVYGLIAVTR